MAKHRTKKNMRKRSRKGGDMVQSLAGIKSNNKLVLSDILKIEDGCDVSEIKSNVEQTATKIDNLLTELGESEPIVKAKVIKEEEEKKELEEEKVLEVEEKKVEEEPVQESVIIQEAVSSEPVREEVITEMSIELSGFKGTVGELISKINDKVGQLRKNKNPAYAATIEKYQTIMKDIKNLKSVDDVKEALKNKVNFKNNIVMGGGKKTKKRGMKKGKRTKKR